MSNPPISPAQKAAMLARGEPFIVAAREVSKVTKAYRTDPEIILGCIIVSGSFDTAAVIRTEILLDAGASVSEAAKDSHTAFRRVWQAPTEPERQAVAAWAERIVGRKRSFKWNGPVS
jgi:hypothetical protein